MLFASYLWILGIFQVRGLKMLYNISMHTNFIFAILKQIIELLSLILPGEELKIPILHFAWKFTPLCSVFYSK